MNMDSMLGWLKRTLLGGVALGLVAGAVASPQSDREAEYYPLTTFPIPEGIVLEAGAIQLLPGQRLAVSTRLGDIYLVDGTFGSPDSVKFKRFASGLHEVLGLWSKGDGWIYATQRGGDPAQGHQWR